MSKRELIAEIPIDEATFRALQKPGVMEALNARVNADYWAWFDSLFVDSLR